MPWDFSSKLVDLRDILCAAVYFGMFSHICSFFKNYFYYFFFVLHINFLLLCFYSDSITFCITSGLCMAFTANEIYIALA